MTRASYIAFLALFSCGSETPDKVPDEGSDSGVGGPVDWTRGAVDTSRLELVRGKATRRGIVHLHSPWSHDACDGEGIINGAADPACLADLRMGLCDAGIDVAWLTDHPDYAAAQPFEDRLHVDTARDTWLEVGGTQSAVRWACDDGRTVLLRPGYEDELMPLGMTRPLDPDPEVEHTLANADTAEAIAAMRSAGAIVAIAHTEGRDPEWLERVVSDGVGIVELVNLHASFDPGIREDDLGWDSVGWVPRIAPFTDPTTGIEPDLFVLAVLAHQPPSLERWDSLNMAGHRVVATAGTDAHQNVLNIDLPDGERGDSYRRMLRWWTHHIRVDADRADDPTALQEALAAGQVMVVAEVLGSPEGFDVWLETASGQTVETGESGADGTLHVVCPTLASGSPRGDEAPELITTVFKNGEVWQTGCGDHPTDGAGVYRVQVEMVPHHLRRFLGAEADEWDTTYPWIYSQPIWVD